MNHKLSKTTITLGICSTLLFGISTCISLKQYSPSIFYHLQLGTSIWSILAVMFCIPSVIATLGLALRRSWSLPLATILNIYLCILLIRFVIVNYKVSALDTYYLTIYSFVISLYTMLTLLFIFSKSLHNYFNFNYKFNVISHYSVKRLVVFACVMAVVIVLQFICLKRYLYYQQYPWPPPDIANSEMHKKWPFFVKGNISNTDIELIVKLVINTEGIDKRILYLVLNSDSSILVVTGELLAPLWGNGNELLLKKSHGNWKVIEKSDWIS